jgi:Na+/phosphate symporter
LNRINEPLLYLVPDELIGIVLVLLIMLGGFCMMVGAKKTAMTLIIMAISFPIISTFIEIIFSDLFAMLPEAYIKPASWIVMGVCYLMMFGVLMRTFFGEKAWDQAKGELLADAIKWLLRKALSLPMLIVWVGFVGYLWLK